jgi:hypothetical protein
MNTELEKIIKQSSFKIEDGKFVYAKISQVPDSLEKHFMVSGDADEITIITKEENLSDLNLLERNKDYYRLIALNVAVPFYSVGFLAAVSGAVAEAGMNILIVSTYSKDYILIKEDKILDAKKVLHSLGFSEK